MKPRRFDTQSKKQTVTLYEMEDDSPVYKMLELLTYCVSYVAHKNF